MIHHILALLLIAFVQFSPVKPAYAAVSSTESVMPIAAPDYPGGQVTNILGQDQNYSVTLRGNGDAVVSARVVFSNLEETPLSTLMFKTSHRISDVMVYQVVHQPICVRYRPVDYGLTPNYYQPQNPICEEYRSPQAYEYMYGGQNNYYKVTVTQEGDTYTLDLPKIVTPNATGSVLIYYRSGAYTRKNVLGGYDFTFETLKTDQTIHSLQVGMSTDSDLLLRDAKSNVQYNASAAPATMKADMVQQEGARSPQLDALYTQIGQGMFVKTATDLQPLDTYTVRGTYAEHRWQLYSREISGVLLLLIVIALIGIWGTRMMIRRLRRSSSKGTLLAGFPARNALIVAISSFASALVITGYTFCLFAFFTMLSSSFYEFMMIAVLFAVIISIGVYSLLLFVPAIVIGVKKGVWYGVASFAVTIGWLVFFMLVSVIVFFAMRAGGSPPMRISSPTMYDTSESGIAK